MFRDYEMPTQVSGRFVGKLCSQKNKTMDHLQEDISVMELGVLLTYGRVQALEEFKRQNFLNANLGT